MKPQRREQVPTILNLVYASSCDYRSAKTSSNVAKYTSPRWNPRTIEGTISDQQIEPLVPREVVSRFLGALDEYEQLPNGWSSQEIQVKVNDEIARIQSRASLSDEKCMEMIQAAFDLNSASEARNLMDISPNHQDTKKKSMQESSFITNDINLITFNSSQSQSSKSLLTKQSLKSNNDYIKIDHKFSKAVEEAEHIRNRLLSKASSTLRENRKQSSQLQNHRQHTSRSDNASNYSDLFTTCVHEESKAVSPLSSYRDEEGSEASSLTHSSRAHQNRSNHVRNLLEVSYNDWRAVGEKLKGKDGLLVHLRSTLEHFNEPETLPEIRPHSNNQQINCADMIVHQNDCHGDGYNSDVISLPRIESTCEVIRVDEVDDEAVTSRNTRALLAAADAGEAVGNLITAMLMQQKKSKKKSS